MKILRAMWDFKTYQYFSQVRCPTLVIAAKPAEPISPDAQPFLQAKQRGIQQAQEEIRNLKVIWMDDSIHDIPLQRPAELAEKITGFLSNVEDL